MAKAPTSIKIPDTTQERISKLVKRTGMAKHAVILRLLNLGLAEAEADWQVLFSEKAGVEGAEEGALFGLAEACSP
jgi:hypothetical protein